MHACKQRQACNQKAANSSCLAPEKKKLKKCSEFEIREIITFYGFWQNSMTNFLKKCIYQIMNNEPVSLQALHKIFSLSYFSMTYIILAFPALLLLNQPADCEDGCLCKQSGQELHKAQEEHAGAGAGGSGPFQKERNAFPCT